MGMGGREAPAHPRFWLIHSGKPTKVDEIFAKGRYDMGVI
jgi:hypothetical protein